MSRSSMLFLIIATFAAGALGAAEGQATKLLKRANIRFGPDTNAPIAGTLDPGTDIEVLRQVKQGWFEVRFPRGCNAWMHEKVLEPVVGAKQFTVMEDKARVRSDATLGAPIVVELSLGDVVEATGKVKGQWHSVYTDKAVAYVNETLVNRAALQGALGVPAVGQAGPAVIVADHVQRLWERADQTYREWKAIANSDNTRALELDWPGLSDQLGQVVTEHKERSVQLQAQRYKNGVDKVAHAQRMDGRRPKMTVPEPEAVPVKAVQLPVIPKPPEQPKQPEVVKQPEQPKQPDVATQPETPKQPDAPAQPETPKQPDAPVQPDIAATPGDANAGDLLTQANGPTTVEGWLEQRDVPEVGAAHVIIDANSNVVAYLTIKPGVDVPLSEYFWRLVAVTGETSSMHNDVPVLRIDAVAMPGR